MRRLLVLSLSASYALCLVVNPDLLTPIKTFGEACGYDACPVALSETGINVHIVPHTHYELGSERTFAQHYTGKEPPWAESKVSMKQTLDSVVTELYMQPHRRFSLADIPYFFHWWSQRDDTVRQMVYELIRQGRLVFIGGGWSMADEATPNYHAIIDSHTFSLRKINATFWKCGRPQVAWQADVMGHSREFASLAAQMGYDALFINPISFDDELARMRRWALEMLWRGSDDLGARSDIYTHKLYDGYWSPPGFCFSSLCTDPLIIHSDNVLSNVEERVKSFVDSMYNRQAPNYNTSHVMVMMGHVNGFFDASMWFSNIDVLINSVNARARKGMQNMYLFYSTPACFAKAVHDYNIVLETKQDDFFPIAYDKNSYITGFYTSCPSIKYQARIALIYLQMCKQMRVFAEIAPYYNKLYEELNWIVGAFHDHSIITGLLKDSVKSYYIEKQHTAVQRSTVLLKDAWNKLRKCPTDTVYYRCTFNQSQCHAIIGDTYFVQIYNPLAWRVTMPVRVPLQCFFYGFEVFDPQGNKVKSKTMAIPYPVMNLHTRTSKSNCEVVFIAEDLPPIGFRSYFIQRIPVEPEHSKVKRESTKMTNDEQEVINKLKVKREAIYKTKLKKEAGDKIKVESKASDDKKSKLKVVNKKKVKPEAIKDIKKIKQVTDKKMTIAIDREVKEVPEQPTVKRVTIKEKKVKAKAINKRGGKQDKTDCKNKFKQEVIDTRVARDKELETPMIKQNATKEKNDKLETTDTHATNEEKVQHKVTEEKEKAIDKRKLKLDTTNERKNNLGGAERPKITIIKQIYSKPMEHVNPKPNKKYLIRQINPATEDYEFIDYNDFIDYNLTVDTTTEISNVSVLLESDGEELKLQKIIGREDFPMMRQTVAPELVKAFPSTTMATSIVSDIDSDFGSDIEARHWGKVMISGKKGLDDIIHSLKPDRTSTAKSDKQIEANTTSLRQYFTETTRTEISNKSKISEIEEIATETSRTEISNESKTIAREDFPMMRQTVAPELIKAFLSTTKATGINSDIDSDFGSDIGARHWDKVMISGKKGLDDIILSMKPDRTSTAKPDKQIEANTTSLRQYFTETRRKEISNKSKISEIEGIVTERSRTADDFPMMRQTVAPELVKAFPSTTKATGINSDIDSDFGSDIGARHWDKVMISGKKGLDDIILSMKPDRTSTAKPNKQIEANTTSLQQHFTETRRTEISNKSKVSEIEEITTEKNRTEISNESKILESEEITTETSRTEISNEATTAEKGVTTHEQKINDTGESLLEKMSLEQTGKTEEGNSNAIKNAEYIEANELPEVVAEPMEITTPEAKITTPETTEKGITEEQLKKYQEDLKKEIERKTFDVGKINNTYIENKYIRVSIDPTSSKVSGVTLSNGVHVDLDIQFYFYASDDPVALGKTGFRKPGALLFRAMENVPIPILDIIDVQVHKNEVVEEAHVVYSDWTSIVIRVYDESPVIEVEWLVGPVPVQDKLGKEVFIRYLTNVVHDGVFYTDSNGRQNIKRIRNLRPQFEPLNVDQVAGNFYPVTSRISIEDLSSRVVFSVFTDRAQGGTSLSDGEVDLMLHRRILTDDTNIGTFVNDTELGRGVAVRGKHYLYISKIDHKPYRIFEKKFAKEIQMAPQVLVSAPNPYGKNARQVWSKSENEISFLKTKLPIGVHILTIETWNDETLLLRLENYLEKSDTLRNHVKTVFIRELFTNIVINSVKETTLGANMWMEEYEPWKWNKKENFVKSFNEFYGSGKEPEFVEDSSDTFEKVDLDQGISLAPQQIRTLVCWFDYVDK